ncbi:hypothetical protein, partial [Burkholderia ambifaria]|uniref:hypothetical protein n=1 Tax=Burkholderia ambifaria TaxID=152480 RepID=UPI001ABBCFB9
MDWIHKFPHMQDDALLNMKRTPWPIIMLLVLAIAWVASRNWKIVAGCFGMLARIGYLDIWEDKIQIVSMI